jgi:hypothetical protein
VLLWAEDGTLLATASQSTIVRRFVPDASTETAHDQASADDSTERSPESTTARSDR